MAESDRVAGIYSEVQYRFDPKSIKTLRKFKRDLMEVKDNIRAIKRLSKGNVKLGFSAKQAKVSQQVQRATEKTAKASSDEVERSAKVWRMKEKILKNQAREARLQKRSSQIAENSQKKQLAMESKIAAQRAKMARMGGMGMQRGKITPASLGRIRNAQERLNRAYRDGSISVSQFNTQSQRLTGILQRQTQAAQRTSMSFNQMRSAIAGATGAYSGFAAGAGIKQIGGQFEDAAIMLETAFGSSSEAQEIMGFLIEQSQRLGVGAVEVSKGFARYSLAGKRMGFTNEQLREQFLGIAEASLVFGLTQQEITGTIRAMEQMA
ncbi:MAG: hypothetical protein Tp1111DCM1126091_104 [Prokaryotic dsDNA virus sp.]|nr:MAG: hypothetical protein Tp1111DCM1126091_104 [Prokaryotic dsDNA virus sp.]